MKIKETGLLLVTLMLSLASACGDGESDNCHKKIQFGNDSKAEIYIAGSFSYPDTSIRLHSSNVRDKIGIAKIEKVLWGRDCFEYHFANPYFRDTLMIFIFDAQVFENTLWDNVVKDYMIKKRYDVSLQDLQNLDWTLTYPPTEAMNNIKQWPLYGE
jgi:hypothetical protein